MADTLDVLSLDEAKQILKLTGSGTTYDTVLAAYITGVSRALDKLVGPIVQRTVTDEEHDGGDHEIFLHHHPNSAITTVKEYDHTTLTTLTAETNSTKPNDAYLVDPYSQDPTLLSNIVRRRTNNADSSFPPGRKNVLVTYDAGRYADTASVDERFKRAAGIVLSNVWRTQQPDTAGTDEFDAPRQNFPVFWIPNSVRSRLDGIVGREVQDEMPL